MLRLDPGHHATERNGNKGANILASEGVLSSLNGPEPASGIIKAESKDAEERRAKEEHFK